MKKIFYLSTLVFVATAGCKKSGNIEGPITPPALSSFAGQSILPYYVENTPTTAFKVPVGLTTTTNSDRTVEFSVSSPTGAVAGTQYTIAGGNKITIPAGKAVDSITVKGIFAGYPGNRKDTLVFTLTGGDVQPSEFNKTFKLVMTKYCNVSLSSFTGNYTKCFDIQPPNPDYGPYSTAITVATAVTATTGFITVANFWDVGGSPIIIDLDWSNPANFTTSVRTQPLYVDPTYGQATIRPVGTGSFSSCDNTFTIKYQVTVAAGSFGNFTTTMAR
jgi:hypothetical protein